LDLTANAFFDYFSRNRLGISNRFLETDCLKVLFCFTVALF
jgi:hypothetical protein